MRTVRPVLHGLLVVILLVVFSYPGCKKEEPLSKKETATAKNLQEAFAFAAKRASWYSKFADEAKTERQPGTASLFRAVARSEEIHGKSHTRLLWALDLQPAEATIDSVAIGTSLQTLKMAVSCEMSQVRQLYPNMIRLAELEGLSDVSAHFARAQSVDLRHLELLKEALDHQGKVAQRSYLICPECGYIMVTGKEEECPACKTKKDTFEKV